LPRAGNGSTTFDGSRRQSTFTTTMTNAEKHGAAAILFVDDMDTAKDGDDVLPFGYAATGSSPAKLPAVHVRREVIDRMLEASLGTSLLALEQDISTRLRAASVALPGWTIDLNVHVERGSIPV